MKLKERTSHILKVLSLINSYAIPDRINLLLIPEKLSVTGERERIRRDQSVSLIIRNCPNCILRSSGQYDEPERETRSSEMVGVLIGKASTGYMSPKLHR